MHYALLLIYLQNNRHNIVYKLSTSSFRFCFQVQWVRFESCKEKEKRAIFKPKKQRNSFSAPSVHMLILQ